MSRTVDVLQFQWGWITPGTGRMNRHEQHDRHIEFLSRPATPHMRHFLMTHCGWWLDSGASRAVRDLTGRNPEPNRDLTPASPAALAALRRFVENGRLEFAAYPYAACVAEATSGEGLLRQFRFSRDLLQRWLGRRCTAALNHDFLYGLQWGTVQMPQIARLLGFEQLVADEDGVAVAPDGTTARIFGADRMTQHLRDGFPRGPIFHPLELTQNMTFHANLPRLRAETPALRGVEFRAITMAEYLRRVPSRGRFDTRAMGSKGWYGGVTDSLLQEQNVKSLELRLPALEALAALRGDAQEELRDLWKSAFILMDNHTLWQCHDYRRHYLPESAKVLARAAALEARLLGEILCGTGPLADREPCGAGALACEPARSRAILFNPTPWRRDLTARVGGRTLVAESVPGWGVGPARTAKAVQAKSDADPFTLSNGDISYRLNKRGEVIEAREGKLTRRFDGLGRLVNIHEKPESRRIPLRAGKAFRFEGALCATATVTLPQGSDPEAQAQFEMDSLTGSACLLQCERLDAAGHVTETQWLPLHSMHWSGPGLPRHEMKVPPRTLKIGDAASLRLTLWLLAEGTIRLGPARLKITHPGVGDVPSGPQSPKRPSMACRGKACLAHASAVCGSGTLARPGQTIACSHSSILTITRWTLRTFYRNAYSGPSALRARVVQSDSALKTVRFTGRLPQTRYEMDVTLRRGSRMLEYALRLRFPRPTALGLSSPPFSKEDGSLLGAQCERPYVPGLAVLFSLDGPARYFADKPFFIQEMLGAPAGRSWHTDTRDWWLGLSPFIGMNLATAETSGGQIGLATRGLKHFFRWSHGGRESLGLSLGATLIHSKTQGHSVLPDSPVYPVARRTDFDPYFATPFLNARGEYEFHYAVAPARRGAAQRLALWKSAQEFALPAGVAHTHVAQAPSPAKIALARKRGLAPFHPFEKAPDPISDPLATGIEVAPLSVIVTGLERRGKELALGLVNMSARPQRARVRLPFATSTARDGTVNVDMPAWGVQEVIMRGNARKGV